MSGFFAEQAASNSLRIPDLTYIFKWEPSVNHWQTPPFCSSVRGSTSHPAISDAPNVQRTPGDHFISASVHAPLSQPPIQSFAAISQGVPHSLYANGAAQAEHYWLDKVRPRGEHAKSNTTVDAMRMPGIQIGVNQVRSGDIDLSYAVERVGCRQTPPFCSSVREGASLTAIYATLNVPHTATPHAPGGHIISASVHAPVFQPPTPSFTADSQGIPHFFYANGAAQAGCYWLDNVRPHVEHAESKTTVDAMCMPGIQIDVNQEVPYVGHESTYARNGPLSSHHGWAEEDLEPLSPVILLDGDPPPCVAPSVLDESVLYGRNWTKKDMLRFNLLRINESVITCQCTDQFKVKEIKTHLKRKHDLKSNSKSHKCFWPECISNKPMTQLSTLVRHIKESHCPVDWQCLICGERFTRDATLSKHFDKCAGRSKLQE